MGMLLYTKIVSSDVNMFGFAITASKVPVKIFESDNGLMGYKESTTGKVRVTPGMMLTYDLLKHIAIMEDDMYQTIKSYAKNLNIICSYFFLPEEDFSKNIFSPSYVSVTNRIIKNQAMSGVDYNQLWLNSKLLFDYVNIIKWAAAMTYFKIFDNPGERMLIPYCFTIENSHDAYDHREKDDGYTVPINQTIQVWISSQHDNMDANGTYQGNHTVHIGQQQQYSYVFLADYYNQDNQLLSPLGVYNIELYKDHLHQSLVGKDKGEDYIYIQSVYAFTNNSNCVTRFYTTNGAVNCDRSGNNFENVKYNFITKRLDEKWQEEYVFWYKNCFQGDTSTLSKVDRMMKYGLMNRLIEYLSM